MNWKEFIIGGKKLHYKLCKDGKKFVFAAIPTLSFLSSVGYQR
ncbi:KxYKxGKxW signal peptide domain-containing protein [Lactobacillus helveticus]